MSNKTLRQTRTEFTKKYPASCKIIKMLIKGKDTESITSKLEVSAGTVRTVKGNLTRGFYLPFVQMNKGEVTGICNY